MKPQAHHGWRRSFCRVPFLVERIPRVFDDCKRLEPGLTTAGNADDLVLPARTRRHGGAGIYEKKKNTQPVYLHIGARYAVVHGPRHHELDIDLGGRWPNKHHTQDALFTASPVRVADTGGGNVGPGDIIAPLRPPLPTHPIERITSFDLAERQVDC
ncbi:hypothetical protein VUR80DRAFT_2784 [Thermomyces stellatus]